MLDDFLHHPATGIIAMVLGVLSIAGSVLSLVGHGLGVLSSGREPWVLLLLGGALLLVGRLLLSS